MLIQPMILAAYKKYTNIAFRDRLTHRFDITVEASNNQYIQEDITHTFLLFNTSWQSDVGIKTLFLFSFFKGAYIRPLWVVSTML